MRKLAYTGLGISLMGAALDFASGYYSMEPTNLQTGAMASLSVSSAALYLMGIAVLAGGVLLALPAMAGRMRRLGLLMEVLGVAMALASYLAPGMSLALSYAMLLVGGAMILNGVLMQRREPSSGDMRP